jgi:hypothetical protein
MSSPQSHSWLRASSANQHTTVRPLLSQLQAIATRALPRMYEPAHGLFVFTQRPGDAQLASSGLSVRYSAITVIGANAVSPAPPPLDSPERQRVVDQLFSAGRAAQLGDTALVGWAGAGDTPAALWDRIVALDAVSGRHPTVEAAWALAALTLHGPEHTRPAAHAVAKRLIAACSRQSNLFPHVLGGSGFRSHVACFADQVYPVHALAKYAQRFGDRLALDTASRCAAQICRLQGAAGQWWWHYDARTGAVIERYPVYAIHQDAMAPMALLALAAAGGTNFMEHIDRGLHWLSASPELGGESLIDARRDMVWRKVARREPGKTSRYVQAAASRVSPRLRVPGLGQVFPPRVIDYEDRPYHWGWFLYAWGSDHRESVIDAGVM